MSTPQWVDDWLTPDRFAKYLRAAGGDSGLGLALYEWNSEIAAAFLRDLGHLEVAVRNAYDRALLTHPDVRDGEWMTATSCALLFPSHMANDKNGNPQDKNATPRDNVKKARGRSGFDAGVVPRGKAIAELMFGFWSYLTDDLHEKSLWVPALHTAYVPGVDRARLHVALGDLREFRNRVAHHESVFDRQPENHRRRIVYVARHLSPDLHQHLTQYSRLPAVLAVRPRPPK
ncbi:MAG TPA: hypothetical protein VGC04_12995 [Cellulomonas sp.]